MATIQMIKREAAKIGATVEKAEGGRYCTYQIVAPEGQRWVDGSCSSLRMEWIWGDSAWRDDAISEVLERMSYGLEVGNVS